MYDLFTRTLAQGLQAFLPIAFGMLWFRRAGDADAVTGLRWGVLVALPATAGAAYLFEASNRQAQWEAGLAMAGLALAIWFARRVVWQSRPATSHASVEPRGRQLFRIACAAAAALIVVRQTMEVAIVFAAALQLRSLDALLAITGGAALSLVVTALVLSIGRRLPASAFTTATRVFAVLFVGQLGMYAFHESAEARLLPWSDVLHSATEPYGPDGIYGRYVSVLLFLVPLAAAAAMLVKARIPRRLLGNRRLWIVRVPQAAVGIVVLVASSIVLMSAIRNDRIPSYTATSPALPARSAAAIAAAPHLLFRHTAIDQNYSRLGITPLDARNPSDRAAAEFTC
jgi:high-affinity iron transporter